MKENCENESLKHIRVWLDIFSSKRKILWKASIMSIVLTLVLVRGGCTNPPNGFRPGAQSRTAKG